MKKEMLKNNNCPIKNVFRQIMLDTVGVPKIQVFFKIFILKEINYIYNLKIIFHTKENLTEKI